MKLSIHYKFVNVNKQQNSSRTYKTMNTLLNYATGTNCVSMSIHFWISVSLVFS